MATDQSVRADPDDAVAYFLEDMTYHGKSDRTQEAYERVLRTFETYLREHRGTTPGAASHRDCMAWVHGLRGDVADSTVATYASYLHRFYAYMNQVGVFDANPMALVVEEMDEEVDANPSRREITLPEMRAFVDDVTHPLERAMIVTMLKTGMRVGELCNLDLRDLSIEAIDDGEHRGTLDGRGNALYVSAEPRIGDTINGEARSASNKRKRSTVVPVDDELQSVLSTWLAVRPDPRSTAEPLFMSTSGQWGARVTPKMVHHVVEKHASEHGWYRRGGGAEENVTPHYFRHFFTTHLRDRTGDRGIVKYLRGDVAGDIIDTYTHNWGDRVRETYERHIYQLL